jgi:hypothetical protein
MCRFSFHSIERFTQNRFGGNGLSWWIVVIAQPNCVYTLLHVQAEPRRQVAGACGGNSRNCHLQQFQLPLLSQNTCHPCGADKKQQQAEGKEVLVIWKRQYVNYFYVTAWIQTGQVFGDLSGLLLISTHGAFYTRSEPVTCELPFKVHQTCPGWLCLRHAYSNPKVVVNWFCGIASNRLKAALRPT